MYRSGSFLTVVVGILAVATALPTRGTAAEPAAPEKVPILLDTDIGGDVDDAFALALASPEVDLIGVTTVGAGAEDRAWMVCRFLTAVGRREVPVAWGRDPHLGGPSIRLHLRGGRPCGAATQLSFRYRLSGAQTMSVRLVNRTARKTHTVELKTLKMGEWAQATAEFAGGEPRAGDRVEEIHFLLPKGAELLVDDVLLYEPGGK